MLDNMEQQSLVFGSAIAESASLTACKVSEFGVFSGPYFTVFGLHTSKTPY